MLSIGQTARLLGISIETLRKWDQNGTFVATRTESGQRRYTQEQIDHWRQNNQRTIEVTSHCVKPSKLIAAVVKACENFDYLKNDQPLKVSFCQDEGYNGISIMLSDPKGTSFATNIIQFQEMELLKFNSDRDE